MTYVMSDIHGCYEEYMDMIAKINLKDTDSLYILGDIIDCGENPIKVLQDMSMRVNVFPIFGDHEYTAYENMKMLVESADSLDAETLEALTDWVQNGGQSTINEFMQLEQEEKEGILEYLEEFSMYETVEVEGKKYILVHAGLRDFDPEKDLDEYEPEDLLFDEADYSKKYFKDTYLVTGHTPTFRIDEESRGVIYKNKNHIAIDCGAEYGEGLGCICLETGKEYYC